MTNLLHSYRGRGIGSSSLPLLLMVSALLGCGPAIDDSIDPEDTATAEQGLTRSPHQTVVDAQNVYSPHLLFQGGQLYMYFGGWKDAGQTKDAIYRATCSGPSSCGSAVKVIDPASMGFEHLNDPTIVRHPNGYYIMYMTGCIIGPEEDCWNLANNHIYYATSWANDGLNWSQPALLLNDYWLPATTIHGTNIYLYANSTVNGTLTRFDLGTSGVVPGMGVPVNLPAGKNYSNVDVMYRPSLGFYQIFGENLGPSAGDSSTLIDYLDSQDGTSWSLVHEGVVVLAAGQKQIRTPAPHPDTHAWVYFGETANPLATENDIRFAAWAP